MSETQYYCLLTDAGAVLEARALAEGKPLRLTHIAVGDGNGVVPTPDPAVTALVHEVHRRPIGARTRSEDDPHIAILHATIPAEEGGWWIRELGVYAEPLDAGGDPVLYAYGNHAPYYKMLPQAGQLTSHELQVPIITSSAANLEIVIPDAGYASASQFRLLAGLWRVHAYQKKSCFFGTLPRTSAGERIFVELFKIVENTQDSANTP